MIQNLSNNIRRLKNIVGLKYTHVTCGKGRPSALQKSVRGAFKTTTSSDGSSMILGGVSTGNAPGMKLGL